MRPAANLLAGEGTRPARPSPEIMETGKRRGYSKTGKPGLLDECAIESASGCIVERAR